MKTGYQSALDERQDNALAPPYPIGHASPNATPKSGKGFEVHQSYMERDWL